MLEKYDHVVSDTTEALKLDPNYVKALLRRAQAYEATDKLTDALKDYEAVLAIDDANKQALEGKRRLPEAIRIQQEKEKEQMIGQLKDLGNSILGKFGLSLDNFQSQQDPTTGNYSIKLGRNG